MRIAVIGGHGFIGSEFSNYAKANGHETVVIGSDCDIFTEEGEKKAKLALQSCDAMVFLAAKRHTHRFSMHEYLYNVRLAERYMQLTVEMTVPNVVITSSCSVYSELLIPWKEDEFQTPLSLYGAAKQAIDSLALWHNASDGMKIKSLRLAQVIGMGERKGFLLNTLIDNAIAKKKQAIYGRGIGRRQYIYVKDVCEAILHCIVSQHDKSGIYNIAMNYNVSIIELAELINAIFGNSAGIDLREEMPEDPREYLMDVSKAKRELGWTAQYDLVTAFEDIKTNLD